MGYWAVVWRCKHCGAKLDVRTVMYSCGVCPACGVASEETVHGYRIIAHTHLPEYHPSLWERLTQLFKRD